LHKKYQIFIKPFTPLILLCAFIISGCGGAPQNSGPLPVIDLTAQYPNKDIVLQDIADIEYVSLNGKNCPLIGVVRTAYISNECYILYDNRNGDVIALEKNGDGCSHFNLKGNGGKEYLNISHLTYDPKKKEIYILDTYGHGILVYSLTGTFVRSFPEYAQQNLTEIYDFDDQTLLAYFINRSTNLTDNPNQTSPYVFISKEDGKIESRLPLHFPNRIPGLFRLTVGMDAEPLNIGVPTNNFRKYGETFVIADISTDTLYTLSRNRQLTPILVRSPSVYDQKDRFIYWSVEFKTDEFLFINISKYDVEALRQQYIRTQMLTPDDLRPENYLYYTKSRKMVIPKFINADWSSTEIKIKMNKIDMGEKNMGVYLFYAVDLVEALEKGELSGKLKEVASTLTYDDNPVLMLVRYK